VRSPANRTTRRSIAKQQEVNLWELRAAVSLAQLRPTRSETLKPATCSRRSMAGSPKAWILAI
jgi:hypothetical protein